MINKPHPDFSAPASQLKATASFGQASVISAINLAATTRSHVRLVNVPDVESTGVLTDLLTQESCIQNAREYAYTDGLIKEATTQYKEATEQLLIDCSLASFESLFGKLHYHQEQWVFQPGLLFTAQNHFILLRAEQLLLVPELVTALAATIRSGQIQWPQQVLQKSAAVELAPTSLLCRIILLGNPIELMALEVDWPDLTTLLPVYGEFNDRVAITEAEGYGSYLALLAQQATGYQLSEDATSFMMRLSSRWAGHNEFFSLASAQIKQLFKEAAAHVVSAQPVQAIHLKQAMQQRHERQKQLSQDSYRDFAEGVMKLQVDGEVMGQVNGLTVIEVGHLSYGEPARITASVHYGDGDVIDIERKAELAGNIHAKGTMILAAYVAQIFAKDAPLHLSANIVFEQSYYEVDGDSASLAELIALLSTLARIPVKQNMAVTGAIDQFGNVQAIGGINEKIEGFFEVANLLKPGQAVEIVMPASSAVQLNLNDSCSDAMRKGLLKVHAIEHVSEAVALLMGVSSGLGKEDERQRYPAETVFGKVQRRLLALTEEIEEEPGLIGRFFARLLRG